MTRRDALSALRSYGRPVRRLITGLDDAGRSCVVEEGTLAFGPTTAGVPLAIVFSTEQSPPSARPIGQAPTFDLGVAPGLARWFVVEYEPNMELPMHHTDTLDFDVVLSGSVELILDDGPHPLEAGDCVVVTGVDHRWRAGPDGCRLSVQTLGTPPPARHESNEV